MKEMKRAIHVDFHTMPGIDDFGRHFSAEDFARTLSEANVDYVNVFARCNIGFSYYPTKVGKPYPTMQGDLFGDIVQECHKRNIGVTAYLNAGLNHQLLIDNPGIMKISKDGSVYSDPDENMNFFRTPCFHSWYREYLLTEIKEVLAYDPDGIFCDIFIPRSCYCQACINKMREKGIDIGDDHAVWAFAVDTVKEVMAEIRAIVPKDRRLYLNSYPYDDIHAMVSHAELECLPSDTGEWGYDYFGVQAPYFRMFSDKPVYMTGRFVNSWGDFGGNRAKAALENDVYDALLWGYAPSIGDHMHPSRGLDKKLYEDIGEIYSYVKCLEQWTDDKKPLAEAAVLRNKMDYEKVKSPISRSDRGVARMLAELKICFDVVNEDMDLSPYKILILPDEIEITDKLYKKLEEYTGSILSSGKSIKAGSEVWDYVTEVTDDDNTDGYYCIDQEVYGQYSCGVKMKSPYSIAEYVDPYFRREFDGLHGYFYNPPKESNEYSAVAVKGNRAHVCFNIFEGYFMCSAQFHKALIERIISTILPERLIEGDLPSYTRATIMSGQNQDVLQIKTSIPEQKGGRGIIEEHICLPEGVEVSILGAYEKVYMLPEMEAVISEVRNGRTHIVLPKICGFKSFLLNKE